MPSKIWTLTLLLGLMGCAGTPSAEEIVDPGPSDMESAQPDAPTPIAVVPNAGVGSTVSGSCPPNAEYPGKGLASLTDGEMGGIDYYDPAWMGWWYEDKPFEVTIDLGKPVGIEELGVHVLTSADSWIFYPRSVQFEISGDGTTFEKVATVQPTDGELDSYYSDTKILKASGLDREAQFVRVTIQRYGELPNWHMGHGGAEGYEGQAWLFVDEILVNPK